MNLFGFLLTGKELEFNSKKQVDLLMIILHINLIILSIQNLYNENILRGEVNWGVEKPLEGMILGCE